MTLLAQIVLLAWLPVSVALFFCMPPRRAVILSFLLGWLFLPVAGYKIPGFLEYSKTTVVPFGALVGVLIYDPKRVMAFRPRWFDLPVLIWCIAPIGASLSNGLGVYDGVSSALFEAFMWGIPYLIGRFYFNDAAGMRELAIGLMLGGLLYVPFCLFEIRMSPILHTYLYGQHPGDFIQSRRFGGWRPTVFMQHGLAVGMWMCMSTLVTYWLWKTKTIKRYGGMTTGFWLVVLLATAILCKSAGALILLALGFVLLQAIIQLRSTTPLMVLVVATGIYLGLRATDAWSPNLVVDATQSLGAARSNSLEFRLHNEAELVGNALEQPIFGWGKWGRGLEIEGGREHTVTDGLWLITFVQTGAVGLAGMALTFLLPPFLICRRISARQWTNPQYATAVVLGLVSALMMIDNILNAMPNPCLMMAVGGAMGFQPVLAVRKPARSPNQAASVSGSSAPRAAQAAPLAGRNIRELQ